MSLSRAKCGYLCSYLNASDAVPQALQRIVSYEQESRMEDEDVRDLIARTLDSFRGSARRTSDADAGAPLQVEKELAHLKKAFERLRKQYREKVSLAEQAQHVLDDSRNSLNEARASNIETASLMGVAQTDPHEAAAILDRSRKEIPADQPEIIGPSVVVNTVSDVPVKADGKDSASLVTKAKSKISSTKSVVPPKAKVVKRPASDKLPSQPLAKKPKVTAQNSVPGTDSSKSYTKKTDTISDHPPKKKKKAKKDTKEEGWMSLYKNTPWKGTGKLPPLCGPSQAVAGYIIPVGDFVAAKNPQKASEAPSWMVATVVKYSQSRKVYEVEDVDAEEAKASKKGTKMTIPRDSVIPLPLQMPDYTFGKEFPVGRKVIALYPKTTCFYEGKVVHTPSMCKANHYLVEFMDDDDEDEEGGKRVAHALVLDYPGANQKTLNF